MEAPSDILERNLRALSRSSAACARLIESTPPRVDMEFVQTDDGALSGAIGIGPASRALASRRRPLAEAERLSDTIDISECGGVVILGFGLGHHVASVARRMGRKGVVIVYESDLALLRAVFERIDHSDWMDDSNLVIIANPDDAGAMSGAVRGVEGILALGVKVIEHPPSRPRLGHEAERFSATLTQMISAMRATLVTTLVQVEATMRNELMNVDHYATCAGVRELGGIAGGRPAIVVAAGPSLQRNLHLLEDPDLRRRVVIIAVQTMLKPLLERGIRPHFITALDHHEISRRFYEGLRPEDVEGITLIAEPKANPAILDAFPGEIRCTRDAFLDGLLGSELSRRMGAIEPGATVAHLAYYVARHMGCDPVILIGQDLGFTDGQYYASGAAIHKVWAGELNEFNTLEMMEWQRIVRSRRSLRRLTDIHDRPIYTDEQMNSYLVQFERDFASDVSRGLRVIDASEGGVRKKSTTVSTLAEALAAHAALDLGELELPPAPTFDREARLAQVDRRIAGVRADVAKMARDSRRAHRLLEKMLTHHDDTTRVNRLIGEVQEIDKRVNQRQPAFDMVQQLNQVGVLNRFKADRAIDLEDSLTGREKQERQIRRDMTNVSWLADAADQLGSLLDSARAAISGSAKLTSDPAPVLRATARAKIGAIIIVDPDRDALGRSRPLEEIVHGDDNALRLTLRRLARCSRLKQAVLITHEPDRVRALAGEVDGLTITIHATDAHPMAGRARSVRGARAWAAACWRGGLGTMTCYDEILAPTPMRDAMLAHDIEAGVLVGADWSLVDGALVDEIIERYLHKPDKHRLVFSQAAPGLGACLLDRGLVEEVAEKSEEAGSFASIAGMVGYLPIKPQADPIAKGVCVHVDPRLRDVGRRCILDGPDRARIAAAMADDSDDALTLIDRLGADDAPPAMPSEVTLEIVASREATDFRADPDAPAPMPFDVARRLLGELAGTDTPITLAGRGDPLTHERAFEIIELALAAGPVHVRTDLRLDEESVKRLARCGVDVISVDLLAEQASTYASLTGVDQFDRVRANVDGLLKARQSPAGCDMIKIPWIVPRITRCDATYEEIETFFDRWIMNAGAAVIDPLGRPMDSRIEPLEPPKAVMRRRARTTMVILADGTSAGVDVGSIASSWAKVAESCMGEAPVERALQTS